ncbi:ABC transporter substrate-binding protein [Nitratireductor sp. CAU 1489]|uniref:ABC transporter substrate-binding protein n=2 Tax=Nitratireductor arenosus TaxID=2682096 RepID=A0A844QFS9_9HYPH|nr:ABC transporter substrate-binding protein [Nitratireductor arenosus]
MTQRLFLCRWLGAACMAALAACAPARAESVPKRVVSMNLCTDQLAMLIADEDQLHSVSHLAADPGASVLAERAGAYVVNHGLAEEIFLMRPDLVIAGTYTTRTTVALLRRLGFRVEEFAPETGFDDIRQNIARMGAILGRRDRAVALTAALDAGLAALAASPAQGSVAVYSSNSYTVGPGSLADAVIAETGLDNIAASLGISGAGRLPLESLITADPDLVVTGARRFDNPALAQENFRHPAFRAFARQAVEVDIPDKYWLCGAPFTLIAARILKQAARRLEAGQE